MASSSARRCRGIGSVAICPSGRAAAASRPAAPPAATRPLRPGQRRGRKVSPSRTAEPIAAAPPGHGDIYTALVGTGLLDQLIALRRRHTALTRGDLTWVAPRTRNYLAYVRSLGDEAFLVECNTSDKPLRRPRTPRVAETLLGARSPRRMRPWEATIGRLHAG